LWGFQRHENGFELLESDQGGNGDRFGKEVSGMQGRDRSTLDKRTFIKSE
jgi:hypothetical protein